MEQRFYYFDGLRIVSAILVILVHCCSIIFSQYPNIPNDISNSIFVLTGFARIGVLVFFMISGALMLNSAKNSSIKFVIMHRFMRLLIVLLIFSLIYYCAYNYIGEVKHFGIVNFFKSFITNGVDKKFWFLYSLLAIYLCLPILRLMVEKFDRKYLWYFVILSIISTTIKYDLDTFFNINARIEIPIVVDFVGAFVLGYLLNTAQIPKNYRIVIYILGIVGIIFRIFITKEMSIADQHYNIEWVNNHTFNILFSASALFIFARYSDIFNKLSKTTLARELAKPTLGVYLIHPLVIYALKMKMGWSAQDITMSQFVILIFGTIFISFAIAYLLSKIKYVKKLVS